MSDDDLIRRGDALDCFMGLDRIGDIMDAITALPAVTVGVKPLVWGARDDLKGLYEARGADGLYRNIWDQQNGTWVYEGDPTANPQQQARLPTLEAAKAAAQADYEARILAALEPVALTPTAVDDSQTPDPAVNPAALLRDVPRYQTLSGNMLPEDAVLAALSRALILKGAADDR